MKVTTEIYELAVEAMEKTRHVKDRLDLLLAMPEDISTNQAHEMLVEARGLVAAIQEISNRVAGYPAPKHGDVHLTSGDKGEHP